MRVTPEEMNICELSSSDEIINFIALWSDWFYENTPTFNGAIGRSLAYLWPAIAKNNQIEVTEQYAIVRLLRKHGVCDEDPIWKFIDVVA
jgi:hypothetical protein